ncbi:MAG TPA: coniferyl aldehyde dehydrogenase [Alphaproteobacteria bacterium]|jgi:acyl-CoA reductase-like NAD-dependent aldehyde dehydrogenase|nr:coniferyl aldehyde dehydrogenase [Alphaproteobacteria bacterium]HJM52137.1 coniferyl aldehyde dehydrogenase [Alphaproteobacteria bacterium]
MTVAVLHPLGGSGPKRSPITEERLAGVLADQRAAAVREGTPGAAQRRADLDKLLKAVLANQVAIAEAIAADFGHRSPVETALAEVYTTVDTIRHARRHLGRWMRPRRRPVSLPFLPARAQVVYQPLGVVGIISPWNYPFYLALSPLIGVLAAGNRAMIKPSELVPRTADLIENLIADTFAEDQVAVVTGGVTLGEVMAGLPFDHLLFTGSTRVGRLVMRAAAANLTPLTLELGGKSPVIVAPGFDLERAARSIVAGKLLNAGQTCIAPDYVLTPEGTLDALVAQIKLFVARMYPRLGDNPDYSAIVNERHFARLNGLVEDAVDQGAQVIEINPAGEDLTAGGPGPGLKLAPKLVIEPSDRMQVMQDEIFGPILPIRSYRVLDDALADVAARPRPLALYYFDSDARRIERVLGETVSGGVSINETLLHVAQEALPFGGVGPSGMGRYHGFDGFESFSHKKGVFRQSRLNGTALMHPPYGKLARTMLKTLIGR